MIIRDVSTQNFQWISVCHNTQDTGWTPISTWQSDTEMSSHSWCRGQVRYVEDRFQVWNGSFWQPVAQDRVTVSLSWAAEEALSWAQEQVRRRQEQERLARDSEAMRIALENVQRAEDQALVVQRLLSGESVP